MEEIIDLIATDSNATDISDTIKNVLFAKAAEKVELVRPQVANSMFDLSSDDQEGED